MNLTYLQGCRPSEPTAKRDTPQARQAALVSSAVVSKRRITFGYEGGDDSDATARKKNYMDEAHRRWSFLSNFDLSTIKTDAELSLIVKERSGVSLTQATHDVFSWMCGKQFSRINTHYRPPATD